MEEWCTHTYTYPHSQCCQINTSHVPWPERSAQIKPSSYPALNSSAEAKYLSCRKRGPRCFLKSPSPTSQSSHPFAAWQRGDAWFELEMGRKTNWRRGTMGNGTGVGTSVWISGRVAGGWWEMAGLARGYQTCSETFLPAWQDELRSTCSAWLAATFIFLLFSCLTTELHTSLARRGAHTRKPLFIVLYITYIHNNAFSFGINNNSFLSYIITLFIIFFWGAECLLFIVLDYLIFSSYLILSYLK